MAEVPPLIIEILGNNSGLIGAIERSETAIEQLGTVVNTNSAGMVGALNGVVEGLRRYDSEFLHAAVASSAGMQIILNSLGVISVETEKLAALQDQLATEVAEKQVKAAVAAGDAILANQEKLYEELLAAHNAELAAENNMVIQSVIRQSEERQDAAAAEIAANDRKLAEMLAQQAAYMRERDALLAAEAAAVSAELQLENRATQAHLEFVVRERDREAAAAEAAAEKSVASAKGAVNSIGGAISGVGTELSSIGKSLEMNVTLPLVVVGGVATAMSVKYSDAMMKVGSLTNASTTQVKAWSDEVLHLSDQYGVASSEAADALYLIASNNLTGKAATDALTASMEASATGLGKVGDIARLTASILNAYAFANITAKGATDVLVASAREGHMNTETLANAFSRVLPVASAMKVPLGDVGAAFAVISREGMNANEAATSIRAMFSQLEKNSGQTAKGLKEVGLSAQGLRDEIAQKGLLAAMETLRTATDGNDAALSKIFGNVRGLTGVLNILGQDSKSVSEAFDRVRNSVGSTDKAFQAASKTLGFQFNQAFVQLKNSLIAIGDVIAPTVAQIASFIGQFLAKFKELSPELQKFLVQVGLVAAALGPVLVIIGGVITVLGAFVGSIISAVSGIAIFVASIPAITVSLTAVIGTIAAIGPEIAIVVGAITAAIAVIAAVVATITAVFIAAWANSEKLRNAIGDAFIYIKNIVSASIEYIQGKLEEHSASIATIQIAFQKLGDFLSTTIVPLIKFTLGAAFEFLAVNIGLVIDAVAWLVDHFKAGMQVMINAALPLIYAWNTLDLAFNNGNHQILVTNDLFSLTEKQADLTAAAAERLSTSYNHVANAARAAATANALALDKADLTPESEVIYKKEKPPPGPPGPDPLKQQASQIKSDIQKQVTEALQLVKDLGKIQGDAKEQFTALTAGGDRTDLPSVISKAFGSKGSIDSAIAEFTRLNDGLKNASDSQRSILRNMVQQSIDLMTQNAAINDTIQQHQVDLGKTTDGIKAKYDALDKAAAAATAAIKARYDALLPKLETALSDANKAFDKENSVLDKLISARQSAMDSIQSGFTSFVNDMNLDPRARTFTRSLELRLDEVKAFTANIKTLLDKGVNQDLVQQFIQAGPSSAGATVKQLAGASADTIAHVNDMQEQLTTQITGFQSLVSAKWHDAGIAQQQAIVAPLKLAADLAQAALDNAKKSQASELAAAEAYAAQLKTQRDQELADAKAQFDAFSAEMGKKIDANNKALNANAQAIDKTITDLAATLQAQALDAGINAINSLAGGLSNSRALANLVAKAKEAAQAAIQAMRRELGIASPSKVTMEIGGHVAAGLAKGMASENGMISAAAAGMARMAIPNIPYRTLAPYGGMQRTPTASNVSNNSNITVNATTSADPHKIAREVAWLVKVGV